ncbi:transcription elongation factor GreA [Nanchangia anserum]|uniref:Transcription elongation factor GreA n=1 Tax=Nanchangia anserum TaxID=2692125 RepID=A0A8I0GA49_9ACTO|nr:transcription elongation factor GreA [Nanchangia anserum]MBD3689969.1 transcription elongation factor GreA [Nanchangia anserum]QOX82225.1 transcription elongation factor GreA [Nanchangia anserum]
MADTTWLTQDAYDRLQAELTELIEVERPAIAKRIDEARQEGDLKENGGYHAAREQQSWNETRIQQLEELLENAQVGQTPDDDGIVEPGMVVTATIAGREKTFLMGTREAGIGIDLEVFSPDAPMGQAILGHKVGDEVTYEAPNGKDIRVVITDAKPYAG